MANHELFATAGVTAPHPEIKTIEIVDLREAWDKGVDDFKAMPTHLAFLCLIYPIVALISARVYAGYDIVPLVFPLIAGYTLIGPLVATSMYELSRRREYGMDHSRIHVFDILKFSTARPVAALGLLLVVIYVLWLASAQIIYEESFGGTLALVPVTPVDAVPAAPAVLAPPSTVAEFVDQLFSTVAGWTMIIVGCGVGFVFAAVVLSLSVVSFPMILDRKVSAMTAAQTSIRAVYANPVTMGTWGFTVAAVLLIGAIPLFVGLAFVIPILGHATWHLYRKVVAE